MLGCAEYCHNTSHNTSIQLTPYKELYGKDDPPLIPYIPGTSNNE